MSRTAPTYDLRGFLLGTLSEEDSEELELSILSDDGLHELLLATEEELIDEAIVGSLSKQETKHFLGYLNRLPGGPERLEFARGLKASLARSSPLEERQGWIGTLRGLLGTVSGPRLPAWAAAILLLVSAGSVWLWEARDREIPSSHAPDPQAVSGRESDSAFSGTPPSYILRAGRVRGPGDMPQIVLPPRATVLELKLDLGFDAYESYRAVVGDADSRELFSADQLQAAAGRDQILVTFRVPTDRLAAGDYYVLLEGVSHPDTPEAVARYDFRLVFE